MSSLSFPFLTENNYSNQGFPYSSLSKSSPSSQPSNTMTYFFPSLKNKQANKETIKANKFTEKRRKRKAQETPTYPLKTQHWKPWWISKSKGGGKYPNKALWEKHWIKCFWIPIELNIQKYWILFVLAMYHWAWSLPCFDCLPNETALEKMIFHLWPIVNWK